MSENYCSFLRPPKPLIVEHDKDMAREWKLWKQQYEYFEIATGITEKPQNIQIATFMSAIGYTAIQVFNSLPTSLPPRGEQTLDQVKSKFETYFTPKVNTTFERYKFHKITQKEGETIDELVTRLRLQANNCAFEQLTDSILRDQLILGVRNDDLRTKLLSEDIGLNKAIQICQSTELAQKQTALITEEHERQVSAIDKSSKFNARAFDCRNCGKNHTVRNCSAYKHICKICKQRNHFEAYCRKNKFQHKNNKQSKASTSKGKEINLCDEQSESENDDFDFPLFVGSVSHNQFVNDDKFTETIIINGQSHKIKLDTGAQCNVLSQNVIENSKSRLIPCSTKNLISFSNHRIKVLGESIVTCTIANRDYNITFKIVAENITPILGASTCEKLGLIKRINEVDQQDSVFEGLGCLKNYEYDIDLIENPKFEISPPRRIPYKIRDDVKKELERCTLIKKSINRNQHFLIV